MKLNRNKNKYGDLNLQMMVILNEMKLYFTTVDRRPIFSEDGWIANLTREHLRLWSGVRRRRTTSDGRCRHLSDRRLANNTGLRSEIKTFILMGACIKCHKSKIPQDRVRNPLLTICVPVTFSVLFCLATYCDRRRGA